MCENCQKYMNEIDDLKYKINEKNYALEKVIICLDGIADYELQQVLECCEHAIIA